MNLSSFAVGQQVVLAVYSQGYVSAAVPDW